MPLSILLYRELSSNISCNLSTGNFKFNVTSSKKHRDHQIWIIVLSMESACIHKSTKSPILVLQNQDASKRHVTWNHPHKFSPAADMGQPNYFNDESGTLYSHQSTRIFIRKIQRNFEVHSKRNIDESYFLFKKTFNQIQESKFTYYPMCCTYKTLESWKITKQNSSTALQASVMGKSKTTSFPVSFL